MKRRETIKRFLLLLFAAALFAWFIPAAAAEQRDSLVENAAQSARDAGVPAEDVAVIVARSLQRGVDSGTVARFLDAAAACGRQGLPVRPVVDRIEQGLAKNVSPDRIAAAVDRLAKNLGQARPFVDDAIRSGVRQRDPAEALAAVAAIARGAEASLAANDMEQLRDTVRSKNGSLALFTRAVDAAAYFAGSGVAPSRAASLADSVVAAGGAERELAALEKDFSELLRQGTKPEDAASTLDRGSGKGHRDTGRPDRKSDRNRNSGGGGSRRR